MLSETFENSCLSLSTSSLSVSIFSLTRPLSFMAFSLLLFKYGTRAYGCQGIFNERWELWDIGIKGLIEKTSLPRLHTALPRNDNSSSVIARLQRLRASEQSDAFRGMQLRTCVEERIDKCVV